MTDRVVHGPRGRARPSVVALLPRGETFRNFVYAGVLDQIADAASLEIASVVPTPELGAMLADRFGPISELGQTSDPRLVRIIRELLETAHGRWLWSEASKERWRRRSNEATGAVARAKLSAKRAIARPFSTPSGLRLLSNAYDWSAERWRPDTDQLRLLRADPPTLVLNTSHVHSTIITPWLQVARQAGSRTAAFLFSWDNLTSQGRMAPLYDDYLVWSEAIRHDLLRIYPEIRPEQVHITGTPQFDAHFDPEVAIDRVALCSWIGADPARPIVLYTTGMPNHMPGEPWIVEDLADRLRSISPASPPQLVVRVYAKDRTGRFGDLQERRSDIIFAPVHWEESWMTPLPEDTPLWVNLLRHADVGVNVASTVSLELCMFDKPVLNVAYNPPDLPLSDIDYSRYYSFDHYRPVVESGAVTVCGSPGALGAAVAEALANPGPGSSARASLLHSMFGDTLDGRSGHRIARTVAGLVGGGAHLDPVSDRASDGEGR